MEAIVIYSSQTNNTKKLAQAVAQQLGCQMRPVAEAGDLSPYSLVAVGFWYKAGQPDPASQKILATLQGKKVFLFATHGAATGSPPAIAGMAKAQELAAGAEIIGSFSCPGEVEGKFLEMAAKKDPPPPWLAAAPAAQGHPNQQDLEAVKKAISQVI